jgi:hypothetical protein
MRKKIGLFTNVPTFTFPSLIDNSPLKKERVEGTDLVFLKRTNWRNLLWRERQKRWWRNRF